MRLLKICTVLPVIVSTHFSCQESSKSDIQHEVGQTVHPRKKPLLSCQDEAKKNEDPATQNALAYVMKIVDELTSKNPETFKGYLKRENFCVSIIKDCEFNATADSRNGHLRIHAGLFQNTFTDASVANVLAHELAHVTLNHSEPIHVFSQRLSESELTEITKNISELNVLMVKARDLDEKISAIYRIPLKQLESVGFDKALQDAYDKRLCKDKCDEFLALGNQLTALEITMSTLDKKISSIISSKYSEEEIANKKEADADEIGLEFLVRADIDPQYGQAIWRTVARMNGQLCYSSHPPRGIGGHPLPCWRHTNQKSEGSKHNEVYDSLLKDRRINFMSSPSLNDVKMELRDYFNENSKVCGGANPPSGANLPK